MLMLVGLFATMALLNTSWSLYFIALLCFGTWLWMRRPWGQYS